MTATGSFSIAATSCSTHAGSDAFAAGHIQNAQFADIDTVPAPLPSTARGADFTGRHPVPERNALLATLRGWGIDDDDASGRL